jgi:hypothetical protein
VERMKKELLGTRITIDIDPPYVKRKVKKALILLGRYGFNKDVDVRVSPGGHGRHIICWSETGLLAHELIMLRRIAGDDPVRIYLDTKTYQHRARMRQVLFTTKKVMKNG